ncbi:hypothetical protein HYH03_015700 [Edaphochlamys debaryana]|uniref:EamA domain-containing protein n=1 Tax=Edaphochlamys debaryana TaxID=47281 RepID=A0A836BS68_9CHLO|nr:hypothetical protein HYH03_015700 [Edaphochlamys debaryana]|eukprot:KAG2485529.1 hypothetical protein HYH03_015700 [Edaphochlamys debaryana]
MLISDTPARPPRTLGLLERLWNNGPALIALASFCFSLTSLCVKLIGSDVPAFETALIGSCFCFTVTFLVCRYYAVQVRPPTWRLASLVLLRGLLGATSITFFYLAIDLLPLQDAVTLFFCSPVVAALLELLVLGESHGWAGAAATASTVAGVVLVAQPEGLFSGARGGGGAGAGHEFGGAAGGGAIVLADGGHVGLQGGGVGLDLKSAAVAAAGAAAGVAGAGAAGAVLATTAAVANASAFVVVRLLRRSVSTLALTWWYHLVVCAATAVPLALGFPSPPVWPSPRCRALLALVGITQFGGQLLLNRGFQLESATRGSAINVLQVLFSFVWDVAVLGDTPAPLSVAGASLVAAGVCLVALTGSPHHHHAHPHHPPHPHPHPHHPPHRGGRHAAGDAYGTLLGGADDGGEAGGGGVTPTAAAHRGGGAAVAAAAAAAAATALVAPWPEAGMGPASESDSESGRETGSGSGLSGRGSAGSRRSAPDAMTDMEAGPGAGARQPLLVRVLGRLSLDWGAKGPPGSRGGREGQG